MPVNFVLLKSEVKMTVFAQTAGKARLTISMVLMHSPDLGGPFLVARGTRGLMRIIWSHDCEAVFTALCARHSRNFTELCMVGIVLLLPVPFGFPI